MNLNDNTDTTSEDGDAGNRPWHTTFQNTCWFCDPALAAFVRLALARAFAAMIAASALLLALAALVRGESGFLPRFRAGL